MHNSRSAKFLSYSLLIALGICSPLFLSKFTQFNSFTSIIWYCSYATILIKIMFFNQAYAIDEPLTQTPQHNRVIAIIPAFNERKEAIEKTVEAILNQTYPVQAIYIVDDGSKEPMDPYIHPRVFCLRQENKGKRHAQAYALSQFKASSTDFILTVDSDSEIEPQAVEKMLKHFNNDTELYGISALVLTSNFDENLMTRIADLNIAISCLISRPIRSYYGALETTSGALAMYRKDILFENLDDYLNSGTYSDDRQLCYYCSLRGRVIALNDLTVISSMPNTLKSTLKQRLRWSKGSWKFFPKQMAHLPWFKKIFPLVSMIQTLSIIAFFIFIIQSALSSNFKPVLTYLAIRLVIRMAQALLYVGNNERMDTKNKFITLGIIVPLELLFTTFVLTYVKYKALFFLKDADWITR